MDEVVEDSAHYMQVYDLDLIYSWTPKEFRTLLRGAHHRQIDDIELLARGAMMNAIANNKKGTTQKKLFDADKARKRMEEGDKNYKDSKVIDLTRYRKAKAAMKQYLADQSKKGG